MLRRFFREFSTSNMFYKTYYYLVLTYSPQKLIHPTAYNIADVWVNTDIRRNKSGTRVKNYSTQNDGIYLRIEVPKENKYKYQNTLLRYWEKEEVKDIIYLTDSPSWRKRSKGRVPMLAIGEHALVKCLRIYLILH